MRVIAAVPALGLLAGCALGLAFPETPLVLSLALTVATASLAAGSARAGRETLLIAGVVLAFCGGGLALTLEAWQQAWRSSLRVAFESMARDQRADAVRRGQTVAEDESAGVVLEGVLTTDASPSATGTASLSVDVEWVGRLGSIAGTGAANNPVQGRVLLTVAGTLAGESSPRWRAGRRIRAPALLRRPSRYLDPGVPDEERVMARRGIVLVGTVKSGALVEVLSRGSPAAELAAAIRARTRTAIRDAVGRFSPRSAAIVTAIVIGDRSGLEPAVQTRLQEAGTYHAIAISGGNIAILAGVTLTLFRLLGILGRGAMLTTIVWLLAYGYLVGGSASVDRATMMAVIYLLGRTLDLGGSSLNVLALVAGGLALRDPLIVADPGFLLTFGATASILATAGQAAETRLPAWTRAVVAMFFASLAAEVTLLPIGASFFSRVTLAGLVLNFAAIPLMAVAQLAGMLAVPLDEISQPLARVAGYVSHLGAEGLVRSADLVRLAPVVTWRVTPPPLLLSGLYYAAGVAALALWQRRRRRGATGERRVARATRLTTTATAGVCGLVMLAPLGRWQAAAGDGRLHVTFIDVGQGDAALVRFPQGATLQVDAGGLSGGGNFDIGERVVAPVLRAAGVGRLGTLVLTHGDADHAGGARALVREFHPWEIWEGVPVPPFVPLQEVAAEARAVGSRWMTVQPADRVDVDGVSVVVRHPPPPDWERQDVRNDDSIVLELRWRDVSFVLTGDIGRDVEPQIAPRFAGAPLRVLKVPHHGSATSSSDAFIRALAPTVAVISVGRSNNYGHPARAVLARYQSAGAAVFRTDQDGAIEVTTDGHLLDVRTFTGRRAVVTSTPRRHEGLEGQ